MVGAGCLFILVLAAAWWFNRRDTLERKRWMLWVLLLCMPLAYLASQAGGSSPKWAASPGRYRI